MNALCGFHLHDARATHGLAAMLAALSDYGKTGAQWTEGGVGLGCRSAGGHERGRRGALPVPRPRRGHRGGGGRPPRRPRHAVQRARRCPRRAFRPYRRQPHPPGLEALGPGMPEPPARRLRLRRVGCEEAHVVLRPGPRRRAALLLRLSSERLRLRQRRGSRPRHAGRLRRAGRGHRGDLSDGFRLVEHDHPYVLQGGAQAAARPYAHRRGRAISGRWPADAHRALLASRTHAGGAAGLRRRPCRGAPGSVCTCGQGTACAAGRWAYT